MRVTHIDEIARVEVEHILSPRICFGLDVMTERQQVTIVGVEAWCVVRMAMSVHPAVEEMGQQGQISRRTVLFVKARDNDRKELPVMHAMRTRSSSARTHGESRLHVLHHMGDTVHYADTRAFAT